MVGESKSAGGEQCDYDVCRHCVIRLVNCHTVDDVAVKKKRPRAEISRTVAQLLDEARWVSLQVGDKVKAWNGNQGGGWIANMSAATVTKDNGNGTYAVKYEDPTQTDDGKPT